MEDELDRKLDEIFSKLRYCGEDPNDEGVYCSLSDALADTFDGDEEAKIKSALKSLLAAERQRAKVMHADLVWCLGKLRGLRYPAKHLEEKYIGAALTEPKR